MASKNEPLPRSRDDPVDTLTRLMCIVDKLHKHVSPKMDNPPYLSSLRNNSDEDPFLRLKRHLKLIEPRLIYLQKLGEDVQDEVSRHFLPLEKIFDKVLKTSSGVFYWYPSSHITKGMKKDIDDINRKISELVGKLSVLPDKPARHKELYSHDSSGSNNGRRCSHLPGLHENVEDLTKLQAFRQVKQEFMKLQMEQQFCLLSFSVFPENREIHRTMLMYWWIGEGILPVQGAEEAVREILKEFTDKNLIQPVQERRKVAPSSYKMTPFVHSSLILLSQDIGLFLIYCRGKKASMNKSVIGKVCLVEGSSDQPEGRPKKLHSLDIETVFNISERYPEFTFKWFSEHSSDIKCIKLSKTVFKSLQVFYLGRWERTKKRHIQVQNPELMKCLELMKNLKFLSFQGISTITKLKCSVCKLHKLIVLDLRECSDLTKLPEKIDSLQSLVYLDMTGCYTLEWIPMRLALLKNLEVLKGFVVSDTMYERVACNLNFLKRLKKLRKLSIEIHRNDLGVHKLMQHLVKLKALTSLRVTWRRGLNIVGFGNPEEEIESLPHQLKKLDLQRFPLEILPTWLQPHKLLHLRKLHIGGGRTLRGFGEMPAKATQCTVEVLRLTSLPKLRVGWIELKKSYFPNLSFLENYECPRVSLTPCDGNGIWRSDQDD